MGFADGVNARVNRDRARAEADARNQELQRMGYSFENGKMTVREGSAAEAEQLQALEAVQLARSLQAKLAAQDSDRAMEDFAYTGDATYLQGALDKNDYLKQAWGQRGVSMVGNIDFDNDGTLLANAGLTPEHYDTPDKRDVLKRNMFKTYDGKEWNVGLLNNAAMETGTLSRLGDRRGGVISDNFEQFSNLLRGPKVSPNTAEGHKYESEINAAAQEFDLPPNLLAAMMKKESGGNPNAVSSKGATGLMQLMPGTAEEMGVTDISNPAQNIRGGARYMRQMLDKYGDLPTALAAYNAGPGNVDKYGGVPPFGETQDYVKTIMANFDTGEKFYGRNAQSVSDTILNHWRAKANAEKGTTNENVDQGVRNETRTLDQADRQLSQKDRQLDQEAEANQLKLLEIQTKLKTDGKTATQKDLDEAAATTDRMLGEFGGEEQFFNTDFGDQKNFNKAYRYMVRMEKLEGTQLSEADKKTITDVRSLLALGDPGSKLTSDQTGLLDSNLASAKKYVSDEVGGVEATSAFAAFRNSVRNALFGSALTEAEITSFNDAYGTLGQKAGPVLQQFKTSLEQVKAKLESTQGLMNPYSAQIRLGKDAQKMNEILAGLDARIQYIEGLSQGETMTPEQKKARKPLADIMSGN